MDWRVNQIVSIGSVNKSFDFFVYTLIKLECLGMFYVKAPRRLNFENTPLNIFVYSCVSTQTIIFSEINVSKKGIELIQRKHNANFQIQLICF